MNEQVLILAAGLALVYATFSRLASRSVVTPPMVFMLVGLLCSPLGLGVIDIQIDNEAITLLATVALTIIVCSDASQVDRREIRKIEQLPIRLLLIGLPLTMLLGTGLAALTFPGFEIAALVLLAVYLGASGYETLIATGIQTIVLSVLLHGVTAAPVAERYGRWMSAHETG